MVGREEKSESCQTPPHAGFRELIPGLYNSQCLLAAATLTLKRFRVFLYTLLLDYLRFEWKRRVRCDHRPFGLRRFLEREGRGNKYG